MRIVSRCCLIWFWFYWYRSDHIYIWRVYLWSVCDCLSIQFITSEWGTDKYALTDQLKSTFIYSFRSQVHDWVRYNLYHIRPYEMALKWTFHLSLLLGFDKIFFFRRRFQFGFQWFVKAFLLDNCGSEASLRGHQLAILFRLYNYEMTKCEFLNSFISSFRCFTFTALH